MLDALSQGLRAAEMAVVGAETLRVLILEYSSPHTRIGPGSTEAVISPIHLDKVVARKLFECASHLESAYIAAQTDYNRRPSPEKVYKVYVPALFLTFIWVVLDEKTLARERLLIADQLFATYYDGFCDRSKKIRNSDENNAAFALIASAISPIESVAVELNDELRSHKERIELLEQLIENAC